MWEKLNKAIKTILEANDHIDNVYTYEATKLKGTPVVTITPSANENDYTTTTENRRIYAFVLRLFVERLSGEGNEFKAEEATRVISDSIIDDFDKNHRLSALEAETGYQFLFLESAPANWGYAGRDNEYRVAEITLAIHFDVDINLID